MSSDQKMVRSIATVIIHTILLLLLLARPCHAWVVSRANTRVLGRLSSSLSSVSSSSWISPSPSGDTIGDGTWYLTPSKAAEETLRWCQHFVIPLQLCPWAAASIQTAGAIQLYTVSSAQDMEPAIDSASGIFYQSITCQKLDPSTAISFVICEDPSWELTDFYEWFCNLEEKYWNDSIATNLDIVNIQSKITLAPFHPDWAFDGDDPSLGFEKKAPYPTVTIVWTDVINAAGEVAANKIGAQNEATLRDRGAAALQDLYQQSVYLKEES